MNIIEKRKGHITVVALIGELNATAGPDAQYKLLQFVQEGKKFMVLDLSQTSYLASAGMRVLLMLSKRIEATDGRLFLAGMSTIIRDILDVSGFLTYFKTFDTMDEAVAALESSL
jgi:anti-anti-sigma factor